MRLLDSLSMARKIGLLIGSALLGILLLLAVFLATERRLILDERRAAVRQTVELAHGILVQQHALVARGDLDEAQARQRALDLIRSLRYSGDEYFWINDLHPRMVMHAARPALDGQDLSTHTDPDGKPLFQEFVRVVRAQGAGFVDYQWPRPGSEHPVPKVSYVKGFAPWGWVVGSGVYVDSVDAAILARSVAMGAGSLLLSLILLAIGLVVGRNMLRVIGGEPAYAKAVTQRIAAGDLGVEIDLHGADQGSLLYAIRTMRNELITLVRRVRDSAESVATASGEIAQGNLDLSRRTEQQAAALQQTAASMEELNGTVQQNADGARRANALAQEATAVATDGGRLVSGVIETMSGIQDSSRRIADIIGVIDGIAFQTNILALNAAVEAARAGDQGRGFAVVAAEVRSLAGHSGRAAKEIRTLIGESVSRVEQGTRQVNQAGATMDEVMASIRRVTTIVAGISTASADQSQGVAQIGQVVSQMDLATQQNAALVEEGAAASESLRDQADRLVGAVAAFRLA
jgi:methyl-accepting chemotaxis protein